MFSLLLAFKNVISRKSSFVIILFITFTIALMVVTNAVFDGTGNGIQNSFVNSFTGDIIIRPKADFPLSLFGDETPVTGEFSDIPYLIPYKDVEQAILDSDVVSQTIPQVSGPATLNIGKEHIELVLFGVPGTSYAKAMPGIHIEEGEPYGDTEKGVMLSQPMVAMIQEESGVELHVGDEIQLGSSDGRFYNMRSAPLTAIYTYPTDSEVLNRIALVSDTTLRELRGMVSVSATTEEDIADEHQNLLSDDMASIDDLFSDAFDMDGVSAKDESNVEFMTNSKKSEIVASGEDVTVWNYIICKLAPNVSEKKALRTLNAIFDKNEWQVQAVGWRSAAGLSAMYLYWMRLIFNIGLVVILGTGFIVVQNTLVVSALDRTGETGTLRAIGADRTFVSLQFLYETALLTVFAGILGCILGVIVTHGLSTIPFAFTNEYLIQLFGGKSLTLSVSGRSILQSFILSLLLAFIGWLYPSHIATNVSPVEAMAGLH